MTLFPSKPSCFMNSVSLRSPASSVTLGNTVSIGSTPAALAANTSIRRAQSSSVPSLERLVLRSAVRSSPPGIIAATRGDAEAMSNAFQIPFAVSRRQNILVRPTGIPFFSSIIESSSSMILTVAASSTFGALIPCSAGKGTTAARSSFQYSVSTPFMRTVTSQLPNSPCFRKCWTSILAVSFSAIATASSRSRTRPSEPKRYPRVSMFGLFPGR